MNSLLTELSIFSIQINKQFTRNYVGCKGEKVGDGEAETQAKNLTGWNGNFKTIRIFPAERSGTPFGVPGFHRMIPVVSLALNHRLMAENPPGFGNGHCVNMLNTSRRLGSH
jgi:hypothetical protein